MRGPYLVLSDRLHFGINFKLRLVELIFGLIIFSTITFHTDRFDYSSRIPNAEHTCVGHIISLFFTMRSFYMSVYDVSAYSSFQRTFYDDTPPIL